MKVGQEIIVRGKPKYEYGKLSFAQPEIESYSEERQVLIPVYSDIQGVGAKWIAGKMPLLEHYLDLMHEILPEDIREKKDFQ